MREITQQAVNAFYAKTPFKSGNTEVKVFEEVTILRLHGNGIAYRYTDGRFFISACGWLSNTTKERLNGLSQVSIVQHKGVWYLNGKEWNGELTEIN